MIKKFVRGFQLIFFLFLAAPVFSQVPLKSKSDLFKVVSSIPGEYVYSFELPDLKIDSAAGGSRITLPFAEYLSETDGHHLPVYFYILELPEGGATATVENDISQIHVVPMPLVQPQSDYTVDSFEGTLLSRKKNRQAEISFAGKIRDLPIYRLLIRPVEFIGERGVRFHKKFNIRVRYTNRPIPVHEMRSDEMRNTLKNDCLNIEDAVKFQKLQKASLSKSSTQPAPGPFVKILLDHNGIYKISYDDLVDKTKLSFKGVDPRTFRLLSQGIETRIYVRSRIADKFQSGDFIEFYGEAYDASKNRALRDIDRDKGHHLDPWSDINAYFLSWGGSAGLRLIEENGKRAIPSENPNLIKPPFFTRVKHFERDDVRLSIKDFNLIQPTYTEDIYAFDNGVSYLSASTQTVTTRDYEFTLEEPYFSVVQNLSLKINLQGISLTKHFVEISIDGQRITSPNISWTGQTKKTASINFLSQTLGSQKTHKLQITVPANAERTIDEFALNWFEITYPQAYSVTDNYLEFKTDKAVGTKYEFIISNFTDYNVSVYKKGISRIVNADLVATPFRSDTTYQIFFQDDVPGQDIEYIAVGESAKRSPREIQVYTPPQLTSANHDARYLIITTRAFRDSVRRLENYRKSRGYAAETVTIEDIYDEFNFGVKSPWAIRNFLRYTFSSPLWAGSQGPPLYVALVGDASSAIKSNADFLPTQFIQTEKYGAAASDHWYSLVDDKDILPDFFVGRISISSARELNIYIDKLIAYELRTPAGDWKNKVLFIGGQSDTRGVQQGNPEIPLDVFRYQATNLINQRLEQSFSPERIYAFPGKQFGGGANAVIDAFSNGNLLVTYLGHGGGGIWGDLDFVTGKPLLNAQQVQQFVPNAGKFPIVLSMTCFVGAFDGGKSLSEVMLFAQNAGAIGVYAAGGTGWILGDYQLLDQTMNGFLQSGATAGEAIAKGKTNYLIFRGESDFSAEGAILSNSIFQSYVAQSMVYQFNFLGDPALEIQSPKKSAFTISDYSPVRSSVITATGTTSFSGGAGVAEIYQVKPVQDSVQTGANLPSFVVLSKVNFTIQNFAYQVQLPLGSISNLSDGRVGLRIFGESSNGKLSFNAVDNFTLNGSNISNVRTVPGAPSSTDTVRFTAQVSDPDGIKYVIAQYSRTGNTAQSGIVDTLFPASQNSFVGKGVGPFDENDQITWLLKAKDNLGDSVFSLSQTFRILAGTDLSVASPVGKSIFLGGESNVRINAVIQNLGYFSLVNVHVKFFDGDPLSTGVFLGEAYTDVAGSVSNAGSVGRDTVSIPAVLSNGVHNLYVWIDPDSLLNDIDRSNNIAGASILLNRFNVTPLHGTTYAGLKNDTVTLDSALFFSVPANAVSQNATIDISSSSTISLINQPDAQFAIPKNSTVIKAYSLRLSQNLLVPGKIFVQIRYDTSRYGVSYADSIGLYRWNAANRKWQVLPDLQKSWGTITANVSSTNSQFVLLINRDYLPPSVETTIEGQFFSNGSIAPRKNPKISAIVYDQNGVSLDRADIVIKIDGNDLDATQVTIPDSLQGQNTVPITLNLNREFQDGTHTMTLQAKDINGNMSPTDTLSFEVLSKFKIELFGNYPNPFANTTTIAFRVEAGETLDDLDISIYTVSGRRIRHITPTDPNVSNQILNSIGYHEVIWDALDDDGRRIANGIYFYRVRGKLNGKTIEQKGKIGYFR